MPGARREADRRALAASVQTVAGPRPIGADLVVRGDALTLTSGGPPT